MSTNGSTHDVPVVPESMLRVLRDEWHRATGAIQVAQLSGQHAQQLHQAYQTRFATCLQMMGLDPSAKWFVDLNTGVLSNTPPPGSEASPETHGIQTNG